MTAPMTRLSFALAALLLLTLTATAHPVAPATSSGTLVADAFSGCVVSANCDVLSIPIDAGFAHTIVHTVSASHSSGFPPAYNFYLRYTSGGAPAPIPGCPDIFTPGSSSQLQTCTLPAQGNATKVLGYFEALRPHQTGTVSFNHALSAL